MAEVKWIKLATNIFDNRKIKQIEKLPDGYAIVIMWLKMLCLAGDVNDYGSIYFTREIPYTEEMLSAQFNIPLQTTKMALNIFKQFGMIQIEEDIMKIANWDKYQNIEGMEKIREQNRIRQKRWYDNRKLLAESNPNVIPNVTITQPNAIDIDKDIDIDKEDIYMTFPLKNGTEYELKSSAASVFMDTYKNIDVYGELLKAKTWLISNPENRKTSKGMMRFLNGWLSRVKVTQIERVVEKPVDEEIEFSDDDLKKEQDKLMALFGGKC